jgi:hypothetical protein
MVLIHFHVIPRVHADISVILIKAPASDFIYRVALDCEPFFALSTQSLEPLKMTTRMKITLSLDNQAAVMEIIIF